MRWESRDTTAQHRAPSHNIICHIHEAAIWFHLEASLARFHSNLEPGGEKEGKRGLTPPSFIIAVYPNRKKYCSERLKEESNDEKDMMDVTAGKASWSFLPHEKKSGTLSFQVDRSVNFRTHPNQYYDLMCVVSMKQRMHLCSWLLERALLVSRAVHPIYFTLGLHIARNPKGVPTQYYWIWIEKQDALCAAVGGGALQRGEPHWLLFTYAAWCWIY